MHCPAPKPHPSIHIHISAFNPLPTHLTPLSTPLSSFSHLPSTIALHSALTLFVAIPGPDPHDHQSSSIPTCWNSLNSTLPYPSLHHPIRPRNSCPPGYSSFLRPGYSSYPYPTRQTGPDHSEPVATVTKHRTPSSDHLSTTQHSSARPQIPSSDHILSLLLSLCCRDTR